MRRGCSKCARRRLTIGAIRRPAGLLEPGDVLVFNDTRVIPAALSGIRRRGEAIAHIHANLHKRVADDRWRAFVRPARRLEKGDRVQFGHDGEACSFGQLDATVAAKLEGGEIELVFDLAGPDLDIAIAMTGAMPLPPYIAARRAADESDKADYQTHYARREGAVAAPTAGLHFSPPCLPPWRRAASPANTSLCMSAPAHFCLSRADDPRNHHMHAEWGEIPDGVAERLNTARHAGGRIIAVGTTVTRLLESAAAASGDIRAFCGETDIFMTPGYEFRAVDAMITNFHLPRSTLFMLVSAFAGLERMQSAYAHAIASHYRFYSYGDASLLWPQP